MIFDQNWMPKTDNEYQNRLLAMCILMLKAAGGKLVISQQMLLEMQDSSSGSMLSQYQDQKTGDIHMEVVESSKLVQ